MWQPALPPWVCTCLEYVTTRAFTLHGSRIIAGFFVELGATLAQGHLLCALGPCLPSPARSWRTPRRTPALSGSGESWRCGSRMSAVGRRACPPCPLVETRPLQRTRRVPHPVPRRPSPTAAPHHRDRPLRGSRPHPPTVKGPQASAPGAVRGPWRRHGGVPGPGCLVAERRTRPGRGLLRGPVAAAAGGRGLQGWGLAAPAAGPLWVGVPRAGRTGVVVAAVLVGVVGEAEAALGGTGGLEAGLGVIGARGFPLWRQCSGRRSACCAWTRRRRQGS